MTSEKPLAGWRIAYWVLLAGWVGCGALNMTHTRAGFLTNYGADLLQPAWLYIVTRGLFTSEPPGLLAKTLGRTPFSAAGSLFAASTATELSQRQWPRGIFAGTFDPLDIVAFGAGLGVALICDLVFGRGEPEREPEPAGRGAATR